MDTTLWASLSIASVLLVTAIGWIAHRRRRIPRIHERYGLDFDRRLREMRIRLQTASEQLECDERFVRLEIRPLTDDEKARFMELWQLHQARFVDDPRAAVVNAEHLVEEVLRVRGCPMEDLAEGVAHLALDHPDIASWYRASAGHPMPPHDRRGYLGTEELRRELIYYRTLFEDLLMADRRVSERRAFA